MEVGEHGRGGARRMSTSARRSFRSWCAAMALVVTSTSLVMGLGPQASAVTEYPDASGACGVRGLEQAPVSSFDYEADGEARPSDRAERTVPVLMVHGWTGNSTHLTDPIGNFSHQADLSTYGDTPTPSARTLIGTLQYVGGADVYTFDYSDDSAKWVTSDRISGGLADSIRCLAEASGQEVIVIAHSMGGLALRQALGADPDLKGDVSQVITFGTPNTGSDTARVVSTGIDRAQLSGGSLETRGIALLVRQALDACGTAATVKLATGGLCDALPAPARAFQSEAGIALQTGSTQLKALAAWPRDLPVHALAGDTTLTVPRGGFLGLSFRSEDAHVGDLIVGDKSATAGSTTQDYARCRYTISAVHGIGESILSDVKLVTKDETGRNLFELSGALDDDLPQSPCFHGALMRTQKLFVAMLGYVVDDIADRAARVPSTVGATRLERLDPWSDPAVVAAAENAGGAISGCVAVSIVHPEALFCQTSAKCIASADGAEALCPSADIETWSRVRVETSGSSVGASPNVAPIRLRLVDGSTCAFSSGAGPFPPDGFRSWAGGCERPSGQVDVLWSDPESDIDDRLLDWLFLTPDSDGHLRVALGPENGVVDYVGVATIYY
jgi:pimeloyl-ACP methyl ester carboxylesterase